MKLYDFSKVKNYKKVCFVDNHLSPVTHALTLSAAVVGYSMITKKNWREIAVRFKALELAGKCFILVRGKSDELLERNPTLDEVKAHIGLETGAKELTDTMFKRALGASLMMQAANVLGIDVGANKPKEV